MASSVLKIGIDARPLYRPVLKGIGVYVKNLLAHLGRIGGRHRYILFYDKRQECVRRRPAGEAFLECGASLPVGDTFHVWEQICVPWHVLMKEIDVFHATANMTARFQPSPVVVTIHDTKPFEETAGSRRERWYVHGVQPKALRRAAAIICPSEFTRDRVVERLKIPGDRIRVVPNGLDPAFRRTEDPAAEEGFRAKYHLQGPFILFTGGETPSKNITRLIRAYARLKRTEKVPHTLVITGIRSPEVFVDHTREAARLDVDRDVTILGYLSEGELITAYNAAEVFVYPSLMEGFGFPPLEAMACGTPVAASNASSIPEVVGDAALLFDPMNEEEMAAQVHRILTDAALAKELVRKGLERCRLFSWEEAARKNLAVYESVA